MSCDKKFRKRTIEYFHEDHSYRETAKVFGTSVSSLQVWLKQKPDTQNSSEKRTRKRKTDRERLSQDLKLHPDAYQSEIAEYFGCKQQSICTALKKFGYIRKKK